MIITRIIKFPNNKARAFTILDINGDYNIYVNQSLSHEVQQEACAHEISHIRNNDFQSDLTVNQIERVRHV